MDGRGRLRSVNLSHFLHVNSSGNHTSSIQILAPLFFYGGRPFMILERSPVYSHKQDHILKSIV